MAANEELTSVAELVEILDNLPSVVSLWDRDFGIRFVNRAVVDWYGLEPAEVVQRGGAGTLELDRMSRHLPFARAALDGDARTFTHLVTTADGESRNALVQYAPYHRDGRIAGFCSITTDITARVRSDAERRDLARRAAAASERDRVAMDIEGRVVQRLDTVLADLAAAPDVPAFASAHECVRSAVEEVHAAVRGVPGDLGIGALEAEVRDVVTAASRRLGFDPDLTVVGHLDTVRADIGAEIVAVLTEGLSNVSRHADAGRVEVVVAAEGPDVVALVADDGRGIPPTVRSSGMANIRSRAERLGGRSSWLINDDGGTTFEWRVPADRRAGGLLTGIPIPARRAEDVGTSDGPPTGELSISREAIERARARAGAGDRYAGFADGDIGSDQIAEVLDSLPMAIVVWSADDRCQFANLAGAQWLGHDDTTDLVGRRREQGLDRLGDSDLDRVRAALAGERQDFETDLVDEAGGLRRLLVSVLPRTVDDRVVGVYVQASDITERVATEAGLRDDTRRITVLQERRRIAENLHDLVIQQLFAAELTLDPARERVGAEHVEVLDRSLATIDTAIADLRGAIAMLKSAG